MTSLAKPRREKTCIFGFFPGPIQTWLYNLEDGWKLEISDLGSVYEAKTKGVLALISWVLAAS